MISIPALFLLFQPAWPPPGMQCEQRTMVYSVAGPNISAASQVYPKHVAYILSQLRDGTMIQGGPVSGGEKASGFGVYRSAKWEEVEAVIAKDPFTIEKVLEVKAHYVWWSCTAAPK